MKKAVNLINKHILAEINEITHIGGWAVDLKTMQVFWSDEVLKIHEVPNNCPPTFEEALNFYPPDSRTQIKGAIDKSIQDGSHWDLELPFITAKGRRIWIRTTGRTEFENGVAVKLQGAFQDINDRKIEQEQIALSEQKFKNVFNYLGTGLALVSVEGKWLDVNPVLSKILGYTPEELLAITFQDITYPEDLEKDLENLYKLVAGDIESYEIEKRYIHKNRNLVWALLTVSLVRNKDEAPLFFISQVTDITERKMMEDVLIKNNERLTALTNQLKHQNSLLEEFNHIVSHNLRTPAGNINLLLKFYEEAESDWERQELIEQIRTSSVNLSEILNDLVDVLKVKGDDDIATELLNFEQVFEKISHMLSGIIRERDAEITCEFEVPELLYSRIYLESILLNMLSNALKYSANDRKPVIRFKTFKQDGKIVLTVSDNGQGINLEKHGDRIFKLHQTFHRHDDSKGLGLFMTKSQIEGMGGTITVDSRENEGCTFTIQF